MDSYIDTIAHKHLDLRIYSLLNGNTNLLTEQGSMVIHDRGCSGILRALILDVLQEDSLNAQKEIQKSVMGSVEKYLEE